MTSSLLTTATLTFTLLIDIMQYDIKPTIPPPSPHQHRHLHTDAHTHIKVTTKLYAKTKHLYMYTNQLTPLLYAASLRAGKSLTIFFSAQRPSANMEEFLAWDCSLLPVYLKIYIQTFVHYLLTIGYFKGKNAHFNIKLCLISQ